MYSNSLIKVFFLYYALLVLDIHLKDFIIGQKVFCFLFLRFLWRLLWYIHTGRVQVRLRHSPSHDF